MGWFGIEMARAGYVVVAVDHPGNNGMDKMTVPGAILFWERPEDLKAALARVHDDPTLAPHMDFGRLGVAGFSAGGFTSLVAAGAEVDVGRFRAFCAAHPDDGVCKPQREFPVTLDQAMQTLAAPEMAGVVKASGDDHAIPGVRGAFAIAPALVQALDPASLASLKTPVEIVLGEVDPIAPPFTNGMVAAAAIPHVTLKILPSVGHYDFLSACTPAGDAVVPVCKTDAPRGPTHQTTIA
ncbi:MAG: hypothetical protein ABI655_05720, partial [Phenylobacterium sp.]